MRRYAFYFAVAFLAFVIGAFVSFKPYPTINRTSKVEETEKTQSNILAFPVEESFRVGDSSYFEIDKNPGDNNKSKITCTDKKILPVWDLLRKDKEYREATKYYDMQFDCSEDLEVEKVDLNDDGQKEVVLWGKSGNLCGASGNCRLWIYEKKNGKYRLLLQSFAFSDQTKWFEVKKAKSNGYRNLLLQTFSRYETKNIFYKFNGSKYVENKCWFEIYLMNEEKPTIMTCKEYSE